MASTVRGDWRTRSPPLNWSRQISVPAHEGLTPPGFTHHSAKFSMLSLSEDDLKLKLFLTPVCATSSSCSCYIELICCRELFVLFTGNVLSWRPMLFLPATAVIHGFFDLLGSIYCEHHKQTMLTSFGIALTS